MAYCAAILATVVVLPTPVGPVRANTPPCSNSEFGVPDGAAAGDESAWKLANVRASV
jgi:hypothetical protein